MAHIGLSTSVRRRWAAGIGAVFVATLAVMVVPNAPASAAATTFNPFAVNQGFTLVSTGSLLLGNGELEGSAAVFGSLSPRTLRWQHISATFKPPSRKPTPA